MDLKYFKCHIEEELDGAKDYVKRAIEIKPMSSSWGKLFLEMSANELEHAKNLYTMFEEYYKKISETYDKVPDYIEDGKNCIVDMYTECTAKIKYMHSMY